MTEQCDANFFDFEIKITVAPWLINISVYKLLRVSCNGSSVRDRLNMKRYFDL
jgi:hypothetical protein